MRFLVLAVPLLAAVVFALQLAAGAYTSELGSHSDEAAHFVTGLFVHDCIISHLSDWRSFGDAFYAHYPKVGLGHWPPLFYLIQAGWYFLFGASTSAAVALMGVLTTLLALLTTALVRRYVTRRYAIVVGILLITNPLVQCFSSSVMAEILVALLTLSASVSYAWYLRGTRPLLSGLLFGCLASAAIMTKGSGFLLVFVPLLCLMIERKFSRLATIAFWLPAVVVVLACSPFYIFTLDLQRNGMQHDSFSAAFVRQSIPFYSAAFVQALGLGGVALVLSALAVSLFRKDESSRCGVNPTSMWTSLSALVGSVLLLCFLVPCGLEARHLIPAIPPAIVLAARGCCQLIAFIEIQRGQRRLVGWIAVASILAVQLSGFHFYRKDWSGYRNIVKLIHRDLKTDHPICLIAADPISDGMFVAQAAVGSNRPGMFALRTSKLLANDKWNGRQYRPRFRSTAEVVNILAEIGVGWLIVDYSNPEKMASPHNFQIIEIVETKHTDWVEVARFDAIRNGHRHPAAIRVFRRNVQGRNPVDSAATEALIISKQGSKTGASLQHAPAATSPDYTS